MGKNWHCSHRGPKSGDSQLPVMISCLWSLCTYTHTHSPSTANQNIDKSFNFRCFIRKQAKRIHFWLAFLKVWFKTQGKSQISEKEGVFQSQSYLVHMLSGLWLYLCNKVTWLHAETVYMSEGGTHTWRRWDCRIIVSVKSLCPTGSPPPQGKASYLECAAPR